MEKEKKGDLDYLKILEAIRELPFYVGKNLLIDFLLGKNIKKIRISNLNALKTYNCLYDYKKDNISAMIENLINNNLITIEASPTNKFLKILSGVMLTNLI
jgi:superfamily II DNA helicase RecQ